MHCQLKSNRRRRRSGLTLIELLVVVTIMILLTVVTLPALGPAIRGQQVRDGTRELSAFLASARARALERGRPVGVLFERFGAAQGASDPSLMQFAVNVYMCEVPPPYSGDTFSSMVTLRRTGNIVKLVRLSYIDNDGNEIDDLQWRGLIRDGDLIKLNYRGRFYRIDGRASVTKEQNGTPLRPPYPLTDPPWTLVSTDPLELAAGVGNVGQDFIFIPADGGELRFAYQIFRQPVKSSSNVLQLPGNAVVDLQYSGFESDGELGAFATSTGLPTMLMFAPDGSLEQVYTEGATAGRRLEQLYFLVGKREKIGGSTDTLEDPTQRFNFQDPDNRWVAIEPTAGKVITAEVAAGDDTTVGITSAADALRNSRRFAREASPIGGLR